MTEKSHEFANAGLHDYVESCIVSRWDMAAARVLEVGAGSGAFTARLSRLGADVTASDLAQGTHGEFLASSAFQALDLNKHDFGVPFSDDPFDFVVGIEVIEHVESPLNFLRSASQALRVGGRLILTTPNVDNIASRWWFAFRGQLRGAPSMTTQGTSVPFCCGRS